MESSQQSPFSVVRIDVDLNTGVFTCELVAVPSNTKLKKPGDRCYGPHSDFQRHRVVDIAIAPVTRDEFEALRKALGAVWKNQAIESPQYSQP